METRDEQQLCTEKSVPTERCRISGTSLPSTREIVKPATFNPFVLSVLNIGR